MFPKISLGVTFKTRYLKFNLKKTCWVEVKRGLAKGFLLVAD